MASTSREPMPSVAESEVSNLTRLTGGAFGDIFKATLTREGRKIEVVLKKARLGEETDFEQESQGLLSLKHRYVVEAYGICNLESSGAGPCLVMEYMPGGDLRSVLVGLSLQPKEIRQLHTNDLVRILYQVALAMAYLEEKGFVHRDLAARNILLSSTDLVAANAKIGDFGLVRRLCDSAYYKIHGNAPIPLAWSAPEILNGIKIWIETFWQEIEKQQNEDDQRENPNYARNAFRLPSAEALKKIRYSIKSDVWAFGVLIWEVVTFGKIPFSGFDQNEIMDTVLDGQTLPIPEDHCFPQETISLLNKMWQTEEHDRPHFAEIASDLEAQLAEPPEPPKEIPWIVYWLTLLAAIGGFLFGYETGAVSGAIIVLRNDAHSENQVAEALAAAAVFSLLAGIFNDKFGRRPVIIFSSFLFLISACILALSPRTYWPMVLHTGRILVGAAIGLASASVPPYVAETSPTHIRGRMLTLFQLLITLGLWVAVVLNGAFISLSCDPSISWQIIFGIAIIPALTQVVGFFFMPESPRWQVLHGKRDKALATLAKINGSKAVGRHELGAIWNNHEQAEKERGVYAGQTLKKVVLSMVNNIEVKRALVIGCALQIFQQLCGINTVMYYSVSIISMGGEASKEYAIWMSAVTAGFNFVCTFIGIYLVEKIGRRLLLLGSTFGVILTLVLLGTSFELIAKRSPAVLFYEPIPGSINGSDSLCSSHRTCDSCSHASGCGFCFIRANMSQTGSCVPSNSTTEAAQYGRCALNNSVKNNPNFNDPDAEWVHEYCPTDLSFLPVIGMVLYLCCFSAGFGPMPWTVNAEIHPNWARSAGTSLSTAANWSFNLIVSLTFLKLVQTITRQGAFFFYAVITTIGMVLFYFLLPETKDVSLEETSSLFESGWLQNNTDLPKFKRSFIRPNAAHNHEATGDAYACDLYRDNPAFQGDDCIVHV